MGVQAQEYRAEPVSSSGWTGIVELLVGSKVIDELDTTDYASQEVAHSLPCHTGLLLHSEKGGFMAAVQSNGLRWSRQKCPGVGSRPGSSYGAAPAVLTPLVLW